jgi:hypothetical protein
VKCPRKTKASAEERVSCARLQIEPAKYLFEQILELAQIFRLLDQFPVGLNKGVSLT